MGARGELTLETIARIVKHVKSGATVQAAAMAEGISPSTLARWLIAGAMAERGDYEKHVKRPSRESFINDDVIDDDAFKRATDRYLARKQMELSAFLQIRKARADAIVEMEKVQAALATSERVKTEQVYRYETDEHGNKERVLSSEKIVTETPDGKGVGAWLNRVYASAAGVNARGQRPIMTAAVLESGDVDRILGGGARSKAVGSGMGGGASGADGEDGEEHSITLDKRKLSVETLEMIYRDLSGEDS